MKKLYSYGFLAGILNGFLGTGGGILIVPMLKKTGLNSQKSHATSIAIILPLSIITTIIYLFKGVQLDYSLLIPTLTLGIIGAFLGAILLKKINTGLLNKLFSLVIIISGIRILFR